MRFAAQGGAILKGQTFNAGQRGGLGPGSYPHERYADVGWTIGRSWRIKSVTILASVTIVPL
jgi:hypothetical protein